jgi:hypothetical protein
MDQDPAAAEAPYQFSCLLFRVFAEGKESRGIESEIIHPETSILYLIHIRSDALVKIFFLCYEYKC